MNKIASRVAAAAMAAVMAVSFASCKKMGGDVIASKEHIFSTEKITMPEGLTYINTIRYSDGKLFIIGDHNWTTKAENNGGTDDAATAGDTAPADTGSVVVATVNAGVMAETQTSSVSAEDADTDTPEDAAPDTNPDTNDVADNADTPADFDDEPVPVEVADEEYHNETKLMVVNLDGTVENEIIINPDGGNADGFWRNINAMEVTPDGSVIVVEQSYKWDETTGESTEKYKMIKFDASGNKQSETDLEKLVEAASEDYFYISSFAVTEDGKYVMAYNQNIYIVDESGKLLNSVKYENSSFDDVWMNGLFRTGDGRIFTQAYMSKMEGQDYKSETKLIEIDTAACTLGNEYDYTSGGSFMNGTDKYDLLINKDSGLVGYDIETGSSETVIDWLKSGFDTTAMEYGSTTVLPDGRIICVTHDYEYHGGGGYGYGGNDLMLSILTPVDPDTLPDRKLIKLYAMYLGTDVKRQILEFNKNNPEYEIELTSYGDDGDWQDAMKRMNNDMIAGKLPDILVIYTGLPVDSYISKGLLANLYDFMETDAELSKEDFLPNLLEAYEVNGKLHYIIPDFSVSTLVGKTSIVGDKQGWTMDEFIAFSEAHPDSSVMDDRYMTNTGMLNNLVSYNYYNFINKETGECSFDSEDFIKMMEFCKRYPKEIDYESLDQDESYWQNYETQFRADRTLLYSSYISRFKNMRELEYRQFGEPVTFIGYPGEGGNGSAFSSSGTMLAITSKANNKEGAWTFVRYFLTKEYQEETYVNPNSYRFSPRLDVLEKQMELAKERPYWELADGEKEYYDDSYWLDGKEIKIGVNTDEDNQKLMDFIKSVKSTVNYNEEVQKIINEEAGSFFEGQKSAADVARIIQDRVSTYVNEGR